MRISDWSSDVCSSDLKLKRDVRIGVSVIISSNEHPKSSIGEDELTTQVMHAPRPRVHLMGGDGGGWALDDDLAQTRAALAGAIEEADLGKIGRASVGKECVSTSRSRWSPYH